MKRCSGTIFQIQRWSIHDGEGIRSTIFLKGCPLRCRWCANPESWNPKAEVLYFSERCKGCGRCADGKYFEVCPTGARKKIGSTMTANEVVSVIKRDAIFYRESGGGVTFSGGEPFAQPEFLRQLVIACNRQGIDTAVETCGYFSWHEVKDIFEGLDSVFVDIKHMNDEVHQRVTGVSNRKILENIKLISRMHPQTIVRVPLIHEVNANEQNIKEMCEFLTLYTQVKTVELLPYHQFGESKYNAVGAIGYTFTTPDTAQIEKVKKIIREYDLCIADFS